MIGTLPSLATGPTAKNIRALEIDLVNKLTMIPSVQSIDFGYSGKVVLDSIESVSTRMVVVPLTVVY